ncbi:MAG TPA: hypothetical protein VF518_01230, partial [Polyangia bacterium]
SAATEGQAPDGGGSLGPVGTDSDGIDIVAPDTAGPTGTDAASDSGDGAALGTCAEALCLASLLQTCLPGGSCSVFGGGSPSAAFTDICYSNGVFVSQVGEWNGSNAVVSDLGVQRNGVPCYEIKITDPTAGVTISYVVTGPDGQPVATGMADKSNPSVVTLTCNGSPPVTVSATCLDPTFDTSGCVSGTCP